MAGASFPWSNPMFEPEMRKKTVMRRHWKTEPMSVEIAKVIDYEESTERGEIKKSASLEEIVDGDFEPISQSQLPETKTEAGTDPGEPLIGKDGKPELPY